MSKYYAAIKGTLTVNKSVDATKPWMTYPSYENRIATSLTQELYSAFSEEAHSLKISKAELLRRILDERYFEEPIMPIPSLKKEPVQQKIDEEWEYFTAEWWK